jgi:hypothetical protein
MTEQEKELTEKLQKQYEKRMSDPRNRYAQNRVMNYPKIGDQLDDLFKQGVFSEEMTAKIQQVKTDHPKPE